MPSIKDILTTNILMPSSDGLPAANALEPFDISGKVEKANELQVKHTNFTYDIYLKLTDNQSEKFIRVQEVSGFGMDRENNSVPGSARDYVVNLPGPVTYNDIRMKHLFTNDRFFLNWLNDGVTSGGASRLDMELHFTLPTDKTVVFTLYDAFPIAWSIGPLNVQGEDALIELITITFSGLAYQSKDS
ncbi:MAG: phage tail protein [Anaerolineaceae bacterium]|nr:phage tail protein [Anaerolineaceae bacterium]